MSADLSPSPPSASFRELGLSEPVLKALAEVGYESPSPIQAATIPQLLAGKDLVGQAQTGTGKTAAFALPILSHINTDLPATQALVLTPTRELAIQVAEAFQRYATGLKGFHVLPIYGGQSYDPQLRGLKRGVHVVVGTPGRLMDHMKRGTLKLDALTFLVLDEADEMLRMGFIDDVEWILQQTPPGRQVALFSATMPAAIRRIAQNHLKSPAEITIKGKTGTAANIRQRGWLVSGMHKLDALTRILEAEHFDGMIVFMRTKLATEDLAERLEARGFAAAPLNGDIPQQQRERTVARFRDGSLDILVATDVAARGLDVERCSHVVNFDIPTDTESYIHRIGRTGRAGRSGEAILFVTPRERHLLHAIERATRQPIERMELPSAEAVNDRRIERFRQAITSALSSGELPVFRALLEEYESEHNVPAIEIAAALACIVQGDKPMLLRPEAPRARAEPERHAPAARPTAAVEALIAKSPPQRAAERPHVEPVSEDAPEKPRKKKKDREAGPAMETYRIEVGSKHGAQPGNIVGALANEAGLDSQYIGRIDIREDHSLVDLPEGMPKETFRDLQKTRVVGQALRISRLKSDATSSRPTLSARSTGEPGAARPSRPSVRTHTSTERRRIVRPEPLPRKTRPHRKPEG